MNPMNPSIKDYLSSLGKIGGKATGASKSRGDTAYYKAISAKAAAARAAKRAARELKPE